tara:strand:+ start:551 stop:667 length:117 start_codon:yes stop_codon:yes gene_type:complete
METTARLATLRATLQATSSREVLEDLIDIQIKLENKEL